MIGLGLAALGRPAYINLGTDLGADRSVVALRARTHEVLDAARAEGVTYLDAARSYGRAEEFLGEWLRARGIAPGDPFVASKWGYEYVGGWRPDADRHEVKDLGLATLRRQLAETRERLGDHLGLYQIHSATLESGVLDDPGVMGALADLRARGLAIGLTVTGPRQAETIDRAAATGAFDAVQATWNLHERSAEDALARAHAAGMRVIVKEALANGRLAGDAAPPAVRGLGAAPDAIALAAALARPWADVVLSGASSVAMLRANLAAREIEGADLPDRLAGLREAPEAYWSHRSGLPWA